MAPTATGDGYWLVGADGGVYAFGDATYQGSAPGSGGTPAPVTGIEPTSDDLGYWMATTSGSVLHFGDAAAESPAATTAPVSGVSG
jgi:hypothetical protein